MRFRILVVLVVCLALPANAAGAEALTYNAAAAKVRATGGSVQSCQRRALHYFHCWARYWFELAAEEEGPNGEWIELAPEYFSVEWPVDVGLKGASVHEG